MARYQLTLAYDGSGFSGSQRQVGRRTVQGELEQALRSLGWDGQSIILAGRTDAGVHAIGQVATFDWEWSHTEAGLLRAMNAKLPRDMAVHRLQIVDDEFHPRFDAISRTYRYRLFHRPLRDPIRERFAWRVDPPPAGDTLKEAARQLVGRHDFSAFGSATTPKGTTVRTVMKAEWSRIADDEWQFDIQGDAFLYRMVRRLVFVQMAVGQGKLPVEALGRSMAKPPGAGKRSGLPSGLAPAHGLTLVEVAYQESTGK